MPYRFTDSAAYPYKPGSLFLGLDPATGAEVGIQTERNAITIAGAGGGKGTCLIIPNLLRWPHAALVIDPKGENAEETAKERRAMGQRVGVLDPFGASKVPKRFRVSINPLALSRKIDVVPSRDEIFAIADGIVRRTDPKSAPWDDGARSIIAGVIAFVVAMAPPEMRTLAEARRVLIQPETMPADDQGRVGGLRADARDMTAQGGLAAAAGVSILSALDKGKGADAEYLSLARQHSQWLDSPEIDAALSSTSFNLADLANGKGTLFLVLPYGKMDQYSAFLRMVVRVAQNTIAEAGNKRSPDQRCLFILDEFFTLGRIDEIQRAAGNMRSYGLQLWPFLQDFGQLTQLYGDDGSETFFSNADAQIYFANTDTRTLSRVSEQLEKVKPHEAVAEPPPVIAFETKPFRPWRDSKWWESEKQARARFEATQQSARDDLKAINDRARGEYDHRAKEAGTARMTANEVAARVGRGNEDKVARSAIVFAKIGDVLNVKLAPFFDPPHKELAPLPIGLPEHDLPVIVPPHERRSLLEKYDNPKGWRQIGENAFFYMVYENTKGRKLTMRLLNVADYLARFDHFKTIDSEAYRWFKGDWKWGVLILILLFVAFYLTGNEIIARLFAGGIILFIAATIAFTLFIFLYHIIGYLIIRYYSLKLWREGH